MSPEFNLAALLKAAEPDGVTVPVNRSAAFGDGDVSRLVVNADLTRLADAGILTKTRDTFRLPEVLMPVLASVMGQLQGVDSDDTP